MDTNGNAATAAAPVIDLEPEEYQIGPFRKPLQYWMGDVIDLFIAKAEDQQYGVVRIETLESVTVVATRARRIRCPQ